MLRSQAQKILRWYPLLLSSDHRRTECRRWCSLQSEVRFYLRSVRRTRLHMRFRIRCRLLLMRSCHWSAGCKYQILPDRSSNLSSLPVQQVRLPGTESKRYWSISVMAHHGRFTVSLLVEFLPICLPLCGQFCPILYDSIILSHSAVFSQQNFHFYSNFIQNCHNPSPDRAASENTVWFHSPEFCEYILSPPH